MVLNFFLFFWCLLGSRTTRVVGIGIRRLWPVSILQVINYVTASLEFNRNWHQQHIPSQISQEFKWQIVVGVRLSCMWAPSANQGPTSENGMDSGTAYYSSENRKWKFFSTKKFSNFKSIIYFETVISLLEIYSQKIFRNAEKDKRINIVNITFFQN